MSKISIILPIYNTEQYLQRCIDSILAQTFTDFELLLVNDGSTDSSGNICNEYAQKDNRIRVFHKKNGGVSSARNEGLKHAKGEWITFCDSDDWVNPDWLETFMLNSNNVQLIVQSFNVISHNNPCNNDSLYYYDGDVKNGTMLLYNNFMPGSLWNKCIKKTMLVEKNYFFNEQMKFREDEEFLLRLYPFISRMRIVPHRSYNYIVPSFQNKYNSNLFEQFLNIYQHLCHHYYMHLFVVRLNYVKDAVYSLLDSYDHFENNKKYKLKLFRNIIGKDVDNCSQINIFTRFALAYIDVTFLDWILSMKSFFKKNKKR